MMMPEAALAISNRPSAKPEWESATGRFWMLIVAPRSCRSCWARVSVTLTLAVTVTGGATISNTATVSTQTDDVAQANNSATALNSVNTPPVAANDVLTVAEDGGASPVDVLANDTDADADALQVVMVTQGGHGAVALNVGNVVTYSPNPNFFGPDSFTYTISDAFGGSSTAQVDVILKVWRGQPVVGTVAAAAEKIEAAGDAPPSAP